MTKLVKLLGVLALTATMAACATTPPVDLTPPPKKKLDAKTQLESGRTY